MQDNFNLAGFVRNNPLLNEAFEGFSGYKDINSLKEEDHNNEAAYFAEEEDSFIQAQRDAAERDYSDIKPPRPDSSDYDRMFDLGGEQIEKGIMFLLDDGFEPEDVLEMCKMFVDAHSQANDQGKQF